MRRAFGNSRLRWAEIERAVNRKCPKCQSENEAGAKFCNECGSKLGIACPACGKANLAEYCEILSEHFYQGGFYAEAADYAKRATKKAEKSAYGTFLRSA